MSEDNQKKKKKIFQKKKKISKKKKKNLSWKFLLDFHFKYGIVVKYQKDISTTVIGVHHQRDE
jgi:ribosome-binding factor A